MLLAKVCWWQLEFVLDIGGADRSDFRHPRDNGIPRRTYFCLETKQATWTVFFCLPIKGILILEEFYDYIDFNI